jgi:hypothetical protein
MGAELSLFATIASTAFGAIGAISQGNANADAARYSAEVAANNAKIANQNAAYARAAGETKAYDEALKQRAQAGAITAALAANGMDVNSGSALDVRETGREVGETDVERQRSNAALQAYGYRTQATNFEAQSQLDKAQAENEATAGWLKGLGGTLSGLSSIGSKWAAFQTSGV